MPVEDYVRWHLAGTEAVNKYGLVGCGRWNVRSPDEVPLRMLRLTRVDRHGCIVAMPQPRKSGADVWTSACTWARRARSAGCRAQQPFETPAAHSRQPSRGWRLWTVSFDGGQPRWTRPSREDRVVAIEISGRSGVAPLTRAAAEARMRRGRRDRQRATLVAISGGKSRGRVGGRSRTTAGQHLLAVGAVAKMRLPPQTLRIHDGGADGCCSARQLVASTGYRSRTRRETRATCKTLGSCRLKLSPPILDLGVNTPLSSADFDCVFWS